LKLFDVTVAANVPLFAGFVSHANPEVNLSQDTESHTFGNASSCLVETELTYQFGSEFILDVGRTWARLHGEQVVDQDRAAELLTGWGFGLVAFLRGYAVLHGSSIVVNERAISFVGASGTGKSTLCASAVRAGAAFCSDGMTLIDLDTGISRAGPLRWKLCEDAAALFHSSTQSLCPVFQGSTKRFLGAGSSTEGILDCVLVLREGPEPRIEWLSPAEGAFQLIKNAYAMEAIANTHMQVLFERMTALARRVRVGTFTRPFALNKVFETAEWLLKYDFG
jgi:hypothetical protein